MGRKVLALLGVLVLAIATTPACTGGCYDIADPVRAEPQTDCLELYTGESASDTRVCGTPQLGGVNHCSEALTLPSGSPTREPLVIAPDGKIVYAIPYTSAPPAITVTSRGSGAMDYVIIASLGDQPITITVAVHED
jgi:hypothetical protein